ncbi:MAG: two-component regulator propeller domain-containing protein [Bacteroidota bacterium]
MKVSIKHLLFFFFVFGSDFLYSQLNSTIKFERISSEMVKLDKGLSQNSVQTILQDKDGFMWFGTWDGLNRFDGYGFSIIRPDYFNSKSGISSPSIRALYQDKNGFIWIGTEIGLNKYDPQTGNFIQFKSMPSNKKALSSDYINAICEDNNGFLWIATNDGLNKLNTKTAEVSRYYLNPSNANSLSNNSINHLLFDNAGILWIATQKGLNYLNIKTNVFSHYYCNTNIKGSISSDFINYLFEDKKNNLWVGTSNGLNLFNRQKNNFIAFTKQARNPFSISNNDIRTIIQDKNDILWFGTMGGGINYMNPANFKFYAYTSNSNDNTTISNDYINSIYEDKSGNIWIGTAWGGLNKIDKQSKKFRHFIHLNDNKSINNNLVWSIVNDKKGNIWIATNEGVNIYNKKSNTFSYIKHQENNTNSLASNNVRMIVIDNQREDIVWFATLDAGLDKYDIQTKKFKHYQYNPITKTGLSTNRLMSIYEDKYGDIWAGTEFGGLCILNPEKEKFTVFQHNPDDPYSISSNTIYPVYEDKNGIVWVGTYHGLNRYDRNSKRFYNFYHDPKDQKSISSDMIFSIYQDKNGFYWLGTMGGGLNKFNPVTKESKHFTEANGLPNNVVYATIKDRFGDFWLSTNFGLSKFNPTNETFVNFDVKDGVQSHEFNFGAALIDEEGEIFFGGMNGLNAFYPEEILMNKNVPLICITSFKLFNLEIPISLKDGDTIRLNHNENFFSFEFASLDYVNSFKNKYAYYLENFDKTWNYTTATHRFADYTAVAPGKYIFKVKGSNNDGVWNEKGIKIYIQIKAPWYNTLLFYLAVLLFIIISIWGLMVWRIRKIRKKHKVERQMLEIQKQLFELEQKSLRLQMNPHFLFNSLNSIQSFVIEKDTDKAIHYLSRFSQLMRLILVNSQQTFVVLQQELKVIKLYLDLERLRFDDVFNYIIEVDPDIEDEFIAIPPMIIQPYIENAIIHGLIHKKQDGKLSIKLKLIDNYIICTIEDNGIGRKAAKKLKEHSGIKHNSSGMLITQERLDILNKKNKNQLSVKIIDLTNDEGEACGTRIELMIFFIEV